MDSYYSVSELNNIGFHSFGQDVRVSRKASIYNACCIQLGNHVRIDDFCILSGNIKIGNYIHVAAYSALYGGEEGIEILDFANISSRVSIYALSDDYTGETMTSPLIPNKFKNITAKKIVINRHSIIGTNSVVLPGAVIGEGCAFGAFSLINKPVPAWTISAGIPCKIIRPRKKDLLAYEKIFIKEGEADNA